MILRWQLLMLLFTHLPAQELPLGTTVAAFGECNCVTNATLQTTQTHMRQYFHINAIKVVRSIGTLAHPAHEEIGAMFEWTKYRLLKEIRQMHEPLLHDGRVREAIDGLFFDFRRQLFENKMSGVAEWDAFLRASLVPFFKSLFGPVFSCLAAGRCPLPADSAYGRCLERLSHTLYPRLFGEPRVVKISTQMSAAFSRVRLLFFSLETLQLLSTSAEGRVHGECVRRLATVTRCSPCATSGIAFCRESCVDAIQSCLGNTPSLWNSVIQKMVPLADTFDNELYPLEDGLIGAFAHAVENSLSSTAKEVVDACGTLPPERPPPRLAHTKPLPPKGVVPKTSKLIKKFSAYEHFWNREENRLCERHSTEPLCWNGLRHVPSSIDIASVPASAFKNVAPNDNLPRRFLPFSDQLEDLPLDGSFVPFDSDDEDIGSASGFPETHDAPSATPYTTTSAATSEPSGPPSGPAVRRPSHRRPGADPSSISPSYSSLALLLLATLPFFF